MSSVGNFILKILFLSFVVCSISPLRAQDKKVGTEFTASIQPVFLINNALHLDLEGKFKSRYLNFIISPEIYKGKVSDKNLSASVALDDLSGYGLGLSQKINFSNNRLRPYITYGFMYRDLDIAYQAEGFVSQRRDGLEFYEYGPFSDILSIKSVLWSSTLGVELLNYKRLILDFYVGGGLKTSSKKSGQPSNREYSQEYQDYAYNGSVFLAGLKVGYQIK